MKTRISLLNPGWFYSRLIFIAVLLTLTATVLLLFSSSPGQAFLSILVGPFSNKLALGKMLNSLFGTSLAALAASMALRSGVFNLGGEGQVLAGGLMGAGTALLLPGLPPGIAPFLTALSGALAGAVIGGISGTLKALWNTEELISTYLIAGAILPVGQVLLSGPLHDKGSYLIATPPLPDSFQLASWLAPSRLGITSLWTIILLILGWIFLERTRWGFSWKLRGANESFSRYGGIPTRQIALVSLAVSGGLYGLAGSFALLERGQAVQGFTSQTGWDGLAVALIAGSRPSLILPAALIYVWIKEGTGSALLQTDFNYAMSGLIQGLVFLLITIRWYKKGRG